MDTTANLFRDGANYDAMMGGWSRAVGELFLKWISPAPSLDWIDVGCGSGAFTSLVVEQCAPRAILGIDPSEAQLAFARTRGLAPIASFMVGDAMAINVPDASHDVAAAALVVHFMPDPAKGVAEMVRVVRPGGLVAAYAWDLLGGGFPYEAMHVAMRSLGLSVSAPPHPEAADAKILTELWHDAGLVSLEQREFVVSQTFRDFDHYWDAATSAPRIAAGLAAVSTDTLVALKQRLQDVLPPAEDEGVAVSARANAIVGRVPPG